MNRTFALLCCVAALVVGWSAYSKIFAPHTVPTTAAASLTPAIEGSKLYFVPLGNFSGSDLPALTQYYRDKYKLEITVLDDIPIDSSTRDASREQLMAERLAESLREAVPDYAKEPKAILIGFTSEDIYPTSQNWRFAFGWRLANRHVAVVSTARMSLQYIGEPMDAHLPETRLRKMVTKDIGILYYGLPQSQNPNSVLYNGILGIQELDNVGEDF